MARFSQFVLNVFVISQTLSKNAVQSYICSTPTEWLNKTTDGGYYLFAGVGGKWPGGKVKYRLNSTLTDQDKQEVLLAFDEYHKKTCIRFEPYSEYDENYVSIEVDNSVCGMAHVCMMGGYQFVRFGQNCRNKNNMIHQLGHTLCLSHEENRHQGDKFIHYTNDCSASQSGIYSGNPLANRIYDQASQMHFGCDSENKCGYQITSALSVLDADYINALYNCQGCFRHRWISKQSLGSIDAKTIFSFGFNDLGGGAMAPCRAFFKGEVSIGKYNPAEGTCYLGFSNKEYKLCDQFEVLTVPNGLRVANAEYVLVDAYQGMSRKKENAVFKNAVVAGRLPWADGSSSYGHGYIAFGSVPNFQTSCVYHAVWWSGGANRKMDVIGRAWRYKNGTRAFAALCKLEFPLPIFYVLSCKSNQAVAWADDDDYMDNDFSGDGTQDVQNTNESAATRDEFKTALQQHQEDSPSYFFPGFITGFLAFGALLAVLCGILLYARLTGRFGPGENFPMYYEQNSLYEE